MQSKTQHLARNVQAALGALSPDVLFSLIHRALDAFGERDQLELEDALRFILGWVLQDAAGHTYTDWPEGDADLEWVPPVPATLASSLAACDTATFYHTILPVFSEWPVLSAFPPGSCSDGYAWMRQLTTWLSHPSLDEEEEKRSVCARVDTSPRLTTADLQQGTPIPIGDCGDAWSLTIVGDAQDVIDHRPYTLKNQRTPLGLCADAPLVVLYPERGAVDWISLLAPTPLRSGLLFSGAPVWILYLTEALWDAARQQPAVTLATVRAWAAQEAAAFSAHRPSKHCQHNREREESW